MSLLQTINVRPLQDQANEGLKYAFTGNIGTVTDSVVLAVPEKRSLAISGITLSSSSSTATLVSLGWKKGSEATLVFFAAYVSATGPVVRSISLGDWYRGGEQYSLVITTGASGPVVYTIDARLVGVGTVVGYVEHDGAPLHSAPWILTTSAYDRGDF